MTNHNNFPPVKNLSRLVVFLLFQLTAGTAWAQNPVPFINEPLEPDTVMPGSGSFTLVVNGTGFTKGAVVNWNGSVRATTFVNGSRLKATILSSDLAKAGTASVTVHNPGPGGGVSNVVFFPVTLPIEFRLGGSAFSAGSGPGSVTTADFNKDGKLDLAVGDTGSGDVSIMLGNGNGTFRPPMTYSVGQGASFQFFQIAVGDLNADGKLDFVVSDYDDNNVAVFMGNGDGTFQPEVTYVAGPNPTSITIADLNGDGKPDLVVTNQNCTAGGPPCGMGTVSILLGNGDGTFRSQVEYPAGSAPNWVTVGDFNRDGRLDLAVADGNAGGPSTVSILINNGNGTFPAPVSYPLNANAASIATADFNGDGKLDLAVVDNIGLVSILLGNGNGTFQPRTDYPVDSFPWGSLAIGDFNEDGHLDISVGNFGSNTVSVLLGNGDGTFQPEIQGSTGSSPHGVVAGDFNGDGRLDLAVANLHGNTVSILLQDGTVALSPSNLNFGVQEVGTTKTKNVTLTNAGTTTLTISSIGITGKDTAEFAQTHTCGSSLGAGKSCTISVTFNPSQLGPASASLTITDDALGSPQSVALSGTGITVGPDATLSSTSLTFATQLRGTTSPVQSVTLGNYGTATLSITGIGLTGANSGDFVQTNTCGSTLAPGASCTLSVTFRPTHRGQRTAMLSLTDNGLGSPQTVGLTGTGTVVQLNPASLSFSCFYNPFQNRCFCGQSGMTTLTNTGNPLLNIRNISISGDFSETNTCPASLAAGQSCAITVTWSPERSSTGALSISDNGGGSPQTVPLTGSNSCP
jgi:hypothetical protein